MTIDMYYPRYIVPVLCNVAHRINWAASDAERVQVCNSGIRQLIENHALGTVERCNAIATIGYWRRYAEGATRPDGGRLFVAEPNFTLFASLI